MFGIGIIDWDGDGGMAPDIEVPRWRIELATFWREKLRMAAGEDEELGEDWNNYGEYLFKLNKYYPQYSANWFCLMSLFK